MTTTAYVVHERGEIYGVRATQEAARALAEKSAQDYFGHPISWGADGSGRYREDAHSWVTIWIDAYPLDEGGDET